MTLKLAINARFQHRRITGVERYAHEISKRLTSATYFIAPGRPLGQVGGHLWEQFILPAKIQNEDALWSPANAGPWLVRKQAVTIHDASVFDHPEWFNPAFAAWTRLSWKILARRARAIITVSEFSRQRLKHHLNLPDEKIHVIHNGVGKPFEPQSAGRVEAVKEKYGIRKPYFLFVGTLEPRKNLNLLLKAWEPLNLKTHEMFLAGTEGLVFSSVGRAIQVNIERLTRSNDFSRWFASKKRLKSLLHSQAITVNLNKSVTYVSDEDLPALYSGAAAFVYPSFYEGFGLPVLEAMACGTPVITSNTTAFPEIFGDAALLIDPAKPEDITRAMQEILENNSLANTLRERGLKKARELSWESSAAKTEAVFTGIS